MGQVGIFACVLSPSLLNNIPTGASQNVTAQNFTAAMTTMGLSSGISGLMHQGGYTLDGALFGLRL